MTNEELIELQKKDIATLQAQRRFLAEQLATLKAQPKCSERKYEFDTPYFRLDSYGVYCYRLSQISEVKWGVNYEVYTDYRFSEIFSYILSSYTSVSFGTFRNGGYGSRKFTTCISYDDLMKKLKRRARIDYKGKGNQYRKLIDDINKSIAAHKDTFNLASLPIVIEEE